MQKIILLLLISLSNLFSQLNNNWSKLLHHYQSGNQIISKEFYITENILSTPLEEKIAMIKVLNSKDGKDVACNFPARYQYLKTIDTALPMYNLKQCKQLNSFVNSFPKNKVNLVFSSEYTNNPSSAFGHTMLLFSDNEKTFEIGDAVHFAAKTSKKDNFFKYSYKGFKGKYQGYFLREPFYKKVYDYNTLEQRYMYIYELDISKEKILQLIYHLYELRKATFKYYFLNGNCATQTTDLLNTVTDNIRDTKQTYYLPIDTIKDFKKYISKRIKFIPLLNKLNLLVENMTDKEKKLFYHIINTNQDLKKNYPDIVKEAMVNYSTFYFRRFHRIYKNYDNVMKQSYFKTQVTDTILNPLDRTQPSNIGIGIYNQNNENFLAFHYRPLFIDIFDIQFNNMQQSQVNTFTFDIIMNKEQSKLMKFDLVNIKSFVNQTQYYTPMSWSIYSGLNRENHFTKLKYINEIGVGRTNHFFNYLDTTFLVSAGFENSMLYLKPSINVSSYISKNTKIGFINYYKQFDTHNYKETKIYLTLKKDNLIYQFNTNYNSGINNKNFLLSIKYNF